MEKVKRYWALFEDIVAGTFFTTGITLVFYGVLMRYIFNAPQSWVLEVSIYLLIWGALFGLAVALRNNRHLQVDILYSVMTHSLKRVINVFANSVGILFCLFYIYYGWLLVVERYTSGMVSLEVGIPMWIVYLILPISGVLFFLRFIERLIASFQGKELENDDSASV